MSVPVDPKPVIRCRSCGNTYPWTDPTWWASLYVAQCWPCAMKANPLRPAPAWWRALARFVRIRW